MDEHFLYVNESFKKMTGYTEADLIGKSPRILQGPLTNQQMIGELKEQLRTRGNYVGQNVNYKKNSTQYIVRWCIFALKNPQNETIAYISYQKEVTQSIWNRNQVQLLSSVIDQVDQVVLVTDLLGIVVYVNKAFLEKYGYTEDEILSKNVNILKSGKQSQEFNKEVWETISRGESFHGVFINKDKKEDFFMEQKTITPIKNKDGYIQFFVSMSQDITKLISKSEAYKEKAYKDTLTKLDNRLKLNETLSKIFSNQEIEKKSFCILLLDIDDFKFLNDNYGHDKGDVVLQNLAKLLRKNLRQNDMIFRWGGEEFILLIEEDIEVSKDIAEKLRKVVEKKLHIESRNITVSIGLAEILPSDTQDTLFKRVDNALYESKKNGKNMITVYR